MKGKVESRQYCGLFEGVTMQKMLFSDNTGPEDDGNALVPAGRRLLAGKQKITNENEVFFMIWLFVWP
ncbi:hypothetical protein [Phocaeicola sp.]|uniref:hypothetical protein n=1 Tax=Phocaeicola sp. TaxID=2773926 RepID=UPI0023C08C72|nr:hypothetical protein [Phocaeicola sp.]MDE5678119.1 hypothetical protein [Phocaeicola sp.]